MRIILVSISLLSLLGCATPRMAYSPDYQERPRLESSLFRSDQGILSEDAVKQIMASKVVLPAKSKVALIKFEGNGNGSSVSKYYGSYYWRSEDYLKLQQHYIDTVSSILLASNRIVEVTPLPSLLLPKDATVPVLREAAVRLQADLLLIFRLTSDTYHEYVMFGKDKVKAFSTCEFVLFDVRTGIIPFTTIITKDVFVREQSEDMNTDELMRRAEKSASIDALSTSSNELLHFIQSLP
jgi:hypothetical protein